MNIRIFSFVFLIFVTLTSQAQSVAVVNSQSILESLAEVKQANSDIEDMKAMFQKKGQEQLQELQMKYQELQQQQASGMLAPVALEQKTAELKAEEQKLREFEQSSQQKLYEKSVELLGPIEERVNQVIKDVATEKGYLYIFDSGTGNILYSDAAIDVTELVKVKLGVKTP